MVEHPNIDYHKLMYHPERVDEWKRNGDCYPIYIEIGLTNRCNHNCIFCALDWLKHGGTNIDSGVLCRNLEDMASSGVKSVMFAGEGEPFLHKDAMVFIKTAKNYGLDVAVTTNGVLFDSKKASETLQYLTWMRFSVDAGTSKTYSKIHGSRKEDFETVLKNIEDAVKIKRANNYVVTIGVQALLTNLSLNELEYLTKKVREIGADNIQIKPYSHHPSSKNDLSFDYDDAEKIRPILESFSNEFFKVIYRTKTIERLNQDRGYDFCYGLPFFALIDAQGSVIPCNLFYNCPDATYGNINEQKFSEIWKSHRRKEIIKKLGEKGVKECRKGCRLDAINRWLSNLKAGNIQLTEILGKKPNHINFI